MVLMLYSVWKVLCVATLFGMYCNGAYNYGLWYDYSHVLMLFSYRFRESMVALPKFNSLELKVFKLYFNKLVQLTKNEIGLIFSG